MRSCRASRGQKWAWTCSDVATAAAVKETVTEPCDNNKAESLSLQVRELQDEVKRLKEEIQSMRDRY